MTNEIWIKLISIFLHFCLNGFAMAAVGMVPESAAVIVVCSVAARVVWVERYPYSFELPMSWAFCCIRDWHEHRLLLVWWELGETAVQDSHCTLVASCWSVHGLGWQTCWHSYRLERVPLWQSVKLFSEPDWWISVSFVAQFLLDLLT